MTFNEWLRQKWYILLACVVIAGGSVAFLLPGFRFPTAAGILLGYFAGYVIYKTQHANQPDAK